RGDANYRLIETRIIRPILAGRIPLALGIDAIASARAAALADPEGEALTRCLAEIYQHGSANIAAEQPVARWTPAGRAGNKHTSQSWRAEDADRRVYALLSKKILRQDASRRRQLQGHGQARALAAGAVRPRASQEDRGRPQGLSADPVLPAAAGGKFRQEPGPDRRVHPPHQ